MSHYSYRDWEKYAGFGNLTKFLNKLTESINSKEVRDAIGNAFNDMFGTTVSHVWEILVKQQIDFRLMLMNKIIANQQNLHDRMLEAEIIKIGERII